MCLDFLVLCGYVWFVGRFGYGLVCLRVCGCALFTVLFAACGGMRLTCVLMC